MAAPPDLTIAPFDPVTASEEELRATYAVVRTGELEELPDDTPRPYEEWLADERFSLSFRRRRRWVARRGSETIGWAWLQDDLENNTHFSWAWIGVVPEHRRNGVGRTLLELLVTEAESVGRTSIVCDVREDFDHSIAFVTKHGLTPRIREHHNRLDLAALDVDMLRDWVSRAQERAAGYELRTWSGPTPDDLLERFAPFTEVMNTAPTDDLDWEDETVTPEQVAEREQKRIDQGYDWWTACVLESATGQLAGYTQLFFTPWRDDIAFQGDTGVDPTHRNKGIGRWVKAANLLRLLEEKPAVAKVDTYNAGSNDAMLSINHALGFAPIEVWVGHQADLDVVRKHLREG